MDGGKEAYEDSDFFSCLMKLMMMLFTKIQNLSQFSGEDKFSTRYNEFESLIKHSDIWYLVGSMFQEHMENNWAIDTDLGVCTHSFIHSFIKQTFTQCLPY